MQEFTKNNVSLPLLLVLLDRGSPPPHTRHQIKVHSIFCVTHETYCIQILKAEKEMFGSRFFSADDTHTAEYGWFANSIFEAVHWL